MTKLFKPIPLKVISLPKVIVYQKNKLIRLQTFLFGVVLGIPMILGSWIGRKIIERLKDKSSHGHMSQALNFSE